MRKRKVIKIDEKEITVKELTVQDILDILDEGAETKIESGGLSDFKGLVEKHLAKATDAKFDDFKNMTPSEIQTVYAGFREVNAAFFDGASRLGLTKLAAQAKELFIRDLSALAQSFLKQGT